MTSRSQFRRLVLLFATIAAAACGRVVTSASESAPGAANDEAGAAPAPTNANAPATAGSSPSSGGSVVDAAPPECPLRDVHPGSFGAWVTPDNLPDGGCAQRCTVRVNVNSCCNEPNTPEMATYDCECRDGRYTCRFLWSGAGLCGDGSTATPYWPYCPPPGVGLAPSCLEIFPTFEPPGSGDASTLHQNPLPVDFGEVPIGSTKALKLRYYDFCGRDDIYVGGVGLAEQANAAFRVTSSPPVGYRIFGSSQAEFQVTFTPTVLGSASTTLVVSTTIGEYQTVISGTGVAP